MRSGPKDNLLRRYTTLKKSEMMLAVADTAPDAPEARRLDPLSQATDLSDLDRAIIRILQDSGRTPYAQIARELGVTEKTVRRRVGDLLAGDVIQIGTVTQPELLGYRAMALVGLRIDHSRAASEIAAELAELAAVDYVVVTTGRYDLLVEVVSPDDAALLQSVEQQVMKVAGVVSGEVLPYLRLHYQEPRWEAARWKADGAGVSTVPVLDEIDGDILAELSENGRAPFQAIARKLDVSESQVRQRVRRMVDSDTVRILALTNPKSLGFRTIAWLGVVAAPGVRVTELASQIASVGSITYVVVCAGRFDIFAEAICVDNADLMSVLDEQVRQLPGVVRTEAFLTLDLRYKPLPAALSSGRIPQEIDGDEQ
jgi:DNA-binding Lrp family transcriptional regulator